MWPQDMEELGVSTFSILPSWCFGFLGKFGEGTEGDLEESNREES